MRSISKRTLRRGAASLLAGTAAATSLLAATASPAAAEPAGTPAATDIVAVGSDTTQGLYDQYQAHYPGLSSWDATGASPITPKDGCAPITRPAGSGAGIAALGANATTADGAHYCIDIARSSRVPAAGDPTGLSWRALATDAVSWAAVDNGNAPATLTAAQLYHIFRCDDGWTHWNDPEIGGTSPDAIVPVLPPASSGTRSFFLSALNASQGQPGALVPGSCVDPTTQPQENEGTDPLFSPANPAAWLVSTARHKAIDRIRRRARLAQMQEEIARHIELTAEDAPVPEDRLRLIFTCCHPALAPEAQVALTLRTLGGLSTEEIARAFLVPTSTMAQRLVRAKAKIRVARIPYEVPPDDAMVERLEAVMLVVYLVFNEGYAASFGEQLVRHELCEQALRLGRMRRGPRRTPPAQARRTSAADPGGRARATVDCS